MDPDRPVTQKFRTTLDNRTLCDYSTDTNLIVPVSKLRTIIYVGTYTYSDFTLFRYVIFTEYALIFFF